MRKHVLVLLLALPAATPVEAGNAKFFSVGAGISFNDYADPRLTSNDLDIVPMYRFSRGVGENGWDWDLKSSVGFSGVELPTGVDGLEVPLGKMRTITVLLGVSRAYRQGPMKIGASVTVGPSFNDLEIDRRARDAFQASGSSLEAVDAKTSIALKPGVSASYRLSSLLALRGSVSYTINRPRVTTRIDGVSTTETWKLDRSSVRLGMVLGIF
jgi:hypothetical protein